MILQATTGTCISDHRKSLGRISALQDRTLNCHCAKERIRHLYLIILSFTLPLNQLVKCKILTCFILKKKNQTIQRFSCF